jgi:ribosomal protein L35AE/L33A
VSRDRWLVHEADGTVTRINGDREAVVVHFEREYPGKQVEAFTDQVLVYEPDGPPDLPVATAEPD